MILCDKCKKDITDGVPNLVIYNKEFCTGCYFEFKETFLKWFND